jgi:metal-responsive CopG/Arc/MetJ family transcriptional regulator
MKRRQILLRSTKKLLEAIDSFVHHNGVKSRNELINNILHDFVYNGKNYQIKKRGVQSERPKKGTNPDSV